MAAAAYVPRAENEVNFELSRSATVRAHSQKKKRAPGERREKKISISPEERKDKEARGGRGPVSLGGASGKREGARNEPVCPGEPEKNIYRRLLLPQSFINIVSRLISAPARRIYSNVRPGSVA